LPVNSIDPALEASRLPGYEAVSIAVSGMMTHSDDRGKALFIGLVILQQTDIQESQKSEAVKVNPLALSRFAD